MTDTPLTAESEALLAMAEHWRDDCKTHCAVTARVRDAVHLIEAAAARRALEGSGVVEADELLELLIGILAEGPNGEYATIDAMERAAKTIHMEWHEAQGRWVTTDRTRPYRAARRALEGSGVVEAAAAFIQRWDDRTYTDAADMVGHCWESIGALRNALAALHRPVASPDPTSNESTGGVASPEEPRVERCTWCGTPIAEHPLTDACAIAQESEADR